MTRVQVKEPVATPFTFNGTLDAELFTQNGGLMRLFVNHSEAAQASQSIPVTIKILELDRYFNEEGKAVDEGSLDDILGTFTATLHWNGQRYFFSDVQRTDPLDWNRTAPYPWFRIAFAGENDTVGNLASEEEGFILVVGKNDDPKENPTLEIGFKMETPDGAFIGSSASEVRYLYGQMSYRPILDLFDIRTELDAVSLLEITEAQFAYAPLDESTDSELARASVAATTDAYQGTIEQLAAKNKKSIDEALQKIAKLIQTSKNPFFQNVQAVNTYHQELTHYRKMVENYRELLHTDPKNAYTLEQTYILPRVDKLNHLEKEIHTYLSSHQPPPESYRKQIERNAAIIQQNKRIEEILNSPAMQILGILPGTGVVAGALKLIQGKHFEGMLDIFGEVVHYGSFLKLSRVARAYRKSSKSTVEMLYCARYRSVVSHFTDEAMMRKVRDISAKASGTFLEKLFGTIDGFKTLGKQVDDVALLCRNQKYLDDMARKGLRGIREGLITDEEQFLDFLRELKTVNQVAQFFAQLRIAHTITKGSMDAYATAEGMLRDVQKLVGYQSVPGVTQLEGPWVKNMQELLELLPELRVDLNNVIAEMTQHYPSDSAIVTALNLEWRMVDEFGVPTRATVRHQNSRQEMLQAMEEIITRWTEEQKKRDSWVQTHKARYANPSLTELRMLWARKSKKSVLGKPPLEMRMENFLQKLQAQIDLKEKLEGNPPDAIDLHFLKPTHRDPGTNLIYDFNSEHFRKLATSLVYNYFQ